MGLELGLENRWIKACVPGWEVGKNLDKETIGMSLSGAGDRQKLQWAANCRVISITRPPEGGAGGEGSEGVCVGWNGPR